jgi:adenylate cyclase
VKVNLRSVRWLNPASLAAGTILLVVALFVTGVPILDLIELKTYDLRFASRGPVRPSGAIVLAVIDEKSLDLEGRWPWPRSKIAALVDILSRAGARVIGFDIAFSEPDENSHLALIDQLGRRVEVLGLKDSRLADFIRESRKDADHDLTLARALKGSSAAVVLGYFFHMDETGLGYRIEPAEVDRQLERISTSKYPVVVYRESESVAPALRAYAPESNLELLTEAAAGSGHFTITTDRDGVVRRIPLVIQGGADFFPPLAVLCAWHYLGKPPLVVSIARQRVEGVKIGERRIPTDEIGRLLVNYLGPPKTFPHVSITDVLGGRVSGDTFKDRIVLVGATATGTHDLKSAPVSPVYPGVEIHASVIDNLLSGNFMVRPRWALVYDLLAILALGTVAGTMLPRMSALRGLVFAGALAVLYLLIARALFVHAGIWLNLVYPLLGLAVSYTALTVHLYVTEERERKKVKETFRHYVAPVVVEEMLKEPQRLKLGGEERILTVLFSDLEGFTTQSERHAPHEVLGILSDYYDRMTEQVFACQGTLKEYVGDELIAFFGAPIYQEDHAQRACSAALAMQAQRRALGQEWARSGRPVLKARTGINSGLMLVGNQGSRYRFSYGVLGDHVNLASRLEGLNRTFRTEILIGENTARLVEAAFFLREIDTVRVKGRVQTVRVYELVAQSAEALPRSQEQALRLYAAGLEAYRQRSWDDALKLFAQALVLWPEDGPSRAMAERSQVFRDTPPSPEWDGAFDQTLGALKGYAQNASTARGPSE